MISFFDKLQVYIEILINLYIEKHVESSLQCIKKKHNIGSLYVSIVECLQNGVYIKPCYKVFIFLVYITMYGPLCTYFIYEQYLLLPRFWGPEYWPREDRVSRPLTGHDSCPGRRFGHSGPGGGHRPRDVSGQSSGQIWPLPAGAFARLRLQARAFGHF